MSQPVLEKDNKIKLPEFRVLKASAGSGKTHALTLRFVQFLISEKIPQNNLRNLTAITFSNNAAREMKERILAWLKAVYLGDNQRSEQLSQLVSLDKNALRCRAGELIEDILENWTEFQVRTIDSFTAAIFTSAAIDLGVPPDFDILLDNTGLMEYAFDFYLRDVKENSPAGELLSRVINSIHQTKTTNTAYLWDPSEAILNQIKAIHCKAASQGRQIIIEDYSAQIGQIKNQIAAQVAKIEEMISESGLVKRKNSSYKSFANIIKNDRFGDLVDKGMANPPVNKPGKDDDIG
ncbi:MAG: UvrD-helicase domain-containing protein, partial [Candidatus Omnitrophica bacterium]|nr:UvrD-helicase domain-containing protein [Candidatus Omnitrophota bacterium]